MRLKEIEAQAGCPGYRFAAGACGLKKNAQSDLALIVSDSPAAAAAVFTDNRFPAAPVIYGRRQLAAGRPVRAVLVNSGNANACTGDTGLAAVRHTAAALGEILEIAPEAVFISSTGVIGEPLPTAKITAALPELVSGLAAGNLTAAATAIMTTDSRPKTFAVQVELAGGPVRVVGLAKGAGMINPRMATMLAYLVTDAGVPAADLQEVLETVVARTFNRISVDGDTSTNDTVLLLANGAAGIAVTDDADRAALAAGVLLVADQLARQIVADGEGATKTVEIVVKGAASAAAAEQVCRAVGNSQLVKTAFYGQDANWGRIIAAVGYAGVALEPEKVDVWLEQVRVVRGGRRDPGYREEDGSRIFRQPGFTVTIDLGAGSGSYSLLTADLSHAYVSINADYRT